MNIGQRKGRFGLIGFRGNQIGNLNFRWMIEEYFVD